MTFADLLAQAREALLAYRLRACLSTLGIVIGVATVVTALAIGEGARRTAVDEIGSLGASNIFVRAALVDGSGDNHERHERHERPGAPPLTLADAGIIARLPARWQAVGAARTARVEIAANGQRVQGLIAGVTPSWGDVFGFTVGAGRWLMGSDLTGRRRVVVIGADLARDVLGSRNPVGQPIVAGGVTYTVVGTLARRDRRDAPRSAIGLFDPDRALLVPLTAMDISLGSGDAIDRVQEIAVRVAAEDEVPAAATLIETLVRKRHPPPARVDFIVPRELLQARLRAQRTFDAVLLAIGALALLISGVGIMNIMLAGIVERTPEIGTRRAFGARRRDVVAQFTLEASLLCGVGGVAGIALGFALSAAVAWGVGWPVGFSPASAALALALASGVGLVFGIYPARLAAGLDPAVALRRD